MASHSIVGKLPLIGATNQNPAGLLEFTMTWKNAARTADVNANASAIFSNGSTKHGADIKRLKDSKGGRCTVIASDEALTLDVVAVPAGAAGANALTDAIKSAHLPAALGFCTIANAPVIAWGGFTDALNSTDWLYEEGGSLEISSDGEWGLRFTVTRSANLAAQVAVAL